MTDLQYQVAIFDLDLTLWDGNQLYASTHTILNTLKQQGIKMYIASFHMRARDCCVKLGIDHYFDDIYFGRDSPKSKMIETVLKKHKDVRVHDVVFFDDNFENILEVKKRHDLKAVHVDGRIGITWNNINIKPVTNYYWDTSVSNEKFWENHIRIGNVLYTHN